MIAEIESEDEKIQKTAQIIKEKHTQQANDELESKKINIRKELMARARKKLQDQTVVELRTMCKSKGLEGYSSARKKDLVNMILKEEQGG